MPAKYKTVREGRDLLMQRRWGWALSQIHAKPGDKPLNLPCSGGGYLFRRHLIKAGECRRCGATVNEIKA